MTSLVSYDKWALITGASSGIGRALALEFAAAHHNVFLTGRDKAALEETAYECSKWWAVRTKIIMADLSDVSSTDQLIAALKDQRLDALVNNAGFGVKGDFNTTSISDELMMTEVQLSAMLKLTKAVLPQMLERGSGQILNVASVYSFSPVPKQSVYSACKAFIFSFSSSLRAEVKDSGVTVTVLCPGITQTEFRTRAGIADKKTSGMTAEAVAKIAVAKTLSGAHVIVPGFSNKVFVFLSRHLPFSLQSALISFINNKRGVNNK
jgi:short-subunit dehydrogenase